MKEKVCAFGGHGIKSTWPIFKTEILTSQSEAFNEKVRLDGEVLFGKNTYYLDPEIRKTLMRGMFGNENSTFHSGP